MNMTSTFTPNCNDYFLLLLSYHNYYLLILNKNLKNINNKIIFISIKWLEINFVVLNDFH